jgi:ATP-dependent Clp protease ATP-binding subunit ClpB
MFQKVLGTVEEKGEGAMTQLHQLLDPMETGGEAAVLEAGLRERIVGQEEAIHTIVDAYQAWLAGMNTPGRPVANLLFLGPTGTGKTRMVEAVAETLAGDARAVVKVDCAEFQHSHEVAKLIGSPPGYLGHRETHPVLSQEAIDRAHTETVKLSFVLFDEIEKASDALWNLLLGILDKATLTLGDNRRVDFSRAFIFLTSNLGAADMAGILRPGFGFAAGEKAVDEKLSQRIARSGLQAARRKFTPEFMNRIDKTIVFHPLGEPEMRQILDIELNQLKHRILDASEGTPFLLSVTAAAKDELLREGVDPRYGARHLRRVIDRAVVHPLSNLVATHQVGRGDCVSVDYDSERRRMAFYKEAIGASVPSAAPESAGATPPAPEIAAAAATATQRKRSR